MTKNYHILNGDALKERFPKTIPGEVIVARECLVDGPVQSDSLSAFFKARAAFISQNYAGFTEHDYFDQTVPEFLKIQNISEHAAIHLWFEDDLFCQVNFWFVVHVLVQSNHKENLFLIRPAVHTPYGFGGLSASELMDAFEHKTELTALDELALLWKFYPKNDLENLSKTAQGLKNRYPFIPAAVEAHIARIPTAGNLGRPTQSLLQIMDDFNTTDFATLFREFSKREAIYGFGDLQVQQLLDAIMDKRG